MEKRILFLLAILLSGSSLVRSQTTQLLPSQCDSQDPFFLNDVLLAQNVPGVDLYQFWFDDGINPVVKTTQSYPVLLYTVPDLSYGEVYDVYVRTRTAGVWSAFGDTCQIEMAPEIPLTKLRAQWCDNPTPVFLNTLVQAENIAGADAYQFNFMDGSNNYIYDDVNYSFFLYEGPDIVAGVTYGVSVRTVVNGDTSAWGDTCQVIISDVVPVVNIRDQYCVPDTSYTFDDAILADWTAGYDSYQWQFIDGSDTINHVSGAYNIVLGQVNGLEYGGSYHTRVRVMIGAEFGEWGDFCTIDIESPVPSSALLAEFCDSDSTFSLSDTIIADPVDPLIQEWVFYFDDGVNPIVYTSTSNEIILQDAGLQGGTTYSVVVEACVQGICSVDGLSCQITIDGNPNPQPTSSQLSPDFCNLPTALELDAIIEANPDSMADTYVFYVTDSGGNMTSFTSVSPTLSLLDIPAVYGETYSVIVETTLNGVESTNGTACSITMAAGPAQTQLQNLYCDSVYHFPSAEILVADQVAFADSYEFRFSQDIGIPLIGSSLVNMIGLDEVVGLEEGFYDVDVRANAGGVWGEWGAICPIELNDSTVSSLSEFFNERIDIYPNPANNVLNIQGLEFFEGPVQLRIVDVKGRIVLSNELFNNRPLSLPANIEAGAYVLRLTTEAASVSRIILIER